MYQNQKVSKSTKQYQKYQSILKYQIVSNIIKNVSGVLKYQIASKVSRVSKSVKKYQKYQNTKVSRVSKVTTKKRRGYCQEQHQGQHQNKIKCITKQPQYNGL